MAISIRPTPAVGSPDDLDKALADIRTAKGRPRSPAGSMDAMDSALADIRKSSGAKDTGDIDLRGPSPTTAAAPTVDPLTPPGPFAEANARAFGRLRQPVAAAPDATVTPATSPGQSSVSTHPRLGKAVANVAAIYENPAAFIAKNVTAIPEAIKIAASPSERGPGELYRPGTDEPLPTGSLEPVTGKQKLVAGAQLATTALAPGIGRGTAAMLEPAIGAGPAALAGGVAAGALPGAAFLPEHPILGAALGGALGAVHAATAFDPRAGVVEPAATEGANLAGHPDRLLTPPGGARASESPRARATTKIDETGTPAAKPESFDAPYSVEMNTPATAASEQRLKRSATPREAPSDNAALDAKPAADLSPMEVIKIVQKHGLEDVAQQASSLRVGAGEAQSTADENGKREVVDRYRSLLHSGMEPTAARETIVSDQLERARAELRSNSTTTEPETKLDTKKSQVATATATSEATKPAKLVQTNAVPSDKKAVKAPIKSGNEPETTEHEFSSTQVNLPKETAAKITKLGAAIPDEDLAPDGRETTPHVTVKYGLHGTDPDAVRKVLADEPPITVTLGKTSFFPNGESGSGDVLKADVDSPDLHRLNKKIADALPHTDTHPTYVPHATIAYVKAGLGKKYAGDTSLEGHTVTIDHVTFSGKDGKTTQVRLGGAKRAGSAILSKGEPNATAATTRDQQDVEPRGRSVPRANAAQQTPPDNIGGAGAEPAARALEGPSGRQDRVRFSDGSDVGIRYRAVEAEHLAASHHPVTFAPNPAYPAGVQGREYAGTRGAAARQHVEAETSRLRPDVLLDAGSSATEGPPLVTPHGIAVAGNQRTMMLQRAQSMAPERAASYKSSLIEKAQAFGLDADKIRAMKAPVLVRQLDDEHVDASDSKTLARLNQLSDTPSTKTKDALSAAMGRASRLQSAGEAPGSALAHFADTIGDGSVRDYLGSANGAQFVRKLFSDGVIAPQERGGMIDAKGNVTSHGKESIEALLRVTAIGDPDVLHRAPASVLSKMDQALPAIIRANETAEYSLQPRLQDALDLLARVATMKAEMQSRGESVSGFGVGSYIQQQDIFENGEPKDVADMAAFLEQRPRAVITQAFRRYADVATAARREASSHDMFGHEPETPSGAERRLFQDERGVGERKTRYDAAQQGMFGDEPAPAPTQDSLFSAREGTESARDLASAERAARAELEQLRQREPLERDREKQVQIAQRIALLTKFVNRGAAISTDEMATRARAEPSGNFQAAPEDGQFLLEPQSHYSRDQFSLFDDAQRSPDGAEARSLNRGEATKAYGSIEKRDAAAESMAAAIKRLNDANIPTVAERAAEVEPSRHRTWASITGANVSTLEDVRAALSVVRHPLAEHFSVLFVDGATRTVKDHFIYTSGALNAVQFNVPAMINEIADRAAQLGVKHVIASHNHPSGDPTASPADHLFTGALGYQLAQRGIVLSGHMVIDHDTATWIAPGASGLEHTHVSVPGADSPEWKTAVQRGHPQLTSASIAGLVRDSIDPRSITTFHLDSQHRIIAAEPHSQHRGALDVLHELWALRARLGAMEAFVAVPADRAGEFTSAITQARLAGEPWAQYVLDVLTVKSHGQQTPNIRSAVDDGRLKKPDYGVREYTESVASSDARRVLESPARSDASLSSVDRGHEGSVSHERSATDVRNAERVAEPSVPYGGSADASDEGVEYRNLGITPPPGRLRAARTALSEAITDPNAAIVARHPELARAMSSANAMSPGQAGTFARQLAERAVRHLTPEQRMQFGARLTLDQIEAEIARKSAMRDAIPADEQLEAHPDSRAFGEREALQETVNRLTREAAKIRGRIPADLERQPWFERALKAHIATVQPFLSRAAIDAGVASESFREPSLGAYLRLIPQERINEPLIRRAQSISAGEGDGATTPRTGVTRRLIGQKRGVMMSSPLGSEAPMQGPVNIQRETPSGGGLGVAGTKQSGSAMRVVGGRDYSTDYLANIQYDAADKLSKAAHNQIFSAIAKDAAKNPDGDVGRVYELPPDKNAPPGMRVIAFNDSKELVDPPPVDDEMSAKVRRFAVPKEVGDAIDRYRARFAYPSAAGRAVRSALGAVTRSVLLNPVVAGTHTLTLASSVGTGIPADAIASGAMTAPPGVKVLSTLARMRAVNFDDPAVAQRLTRLAFNGALRITEDRGAGALDAGHHFLFGPAGMDTRARVVASQDVEAALRKAGITPDDPRFAGLERKYVVEHAGNYVGRNQGTALKWLQDNGIAPFIAINRAKLGTSLKALVGSDGTIDPSAARRLGVGFRGPLGAAAALAAASYLLSGHKPSENAAGHEGDVATGVYHAPDGSFRYYRGSPKDAVAQFGKGTKEVYLRRGIVDPASEAALRVLQPLVTAHSGDQLQEVLRAAVNTGLGFVGPGVGVAWGLTTGKSMYLDQDNNFTSVDEKKLPGEKNQIVKGRLLASARNANVAASLLLPSQGEQPKNATSLGRPFINALAEGSPTGREGAERAQVNAWLDSKRLEILRERDRPTRERMMNDAMAEAERAGYGGPSVRQQLQKAVNRGGRDRGTLTERKFDNRIRTPKP